MRLRSKSFGGLVVAAACVTALAACSSTSSSNSSSSAQATGTPISGGTATFAELPATTPNYIFPFVSSAYIVVSNLNLLQYPLYRPLYWFGNGASPTVNTAKSLANVPVWSNGGETVPSRPKSYRWSIGQPVRSR